MCSSSKQGGAIWPKNSGRKLHSRIPWVYELITVVSCEPKCEPIDVGGYNFPQICEPKCEPGEAESATFDLAETHTNGQPIFLANASFAFCTYPWSCIRLKNPSRRLFFGHMALPMLYLSIWASCTCLVLIFEWPVSHPECLSVLLLWVSVELSLTWVGSRVTENSKLNMFYEIPLNLQKNPAFWLETVLAKLTVLLLSLVTLHWLHLQ